MAYVDKWELSKAAKDCAARTIDGLLEKARRERRIPDRYMFFMFHDGMDDEVNELIDAGFMAYEFMDKGQRIFSHQVDAESLRQALGWTAN